MKNQYLTLALLLISLFGNAQIVNIPDANFKAALLNHQPAIDSNSNGEIDVSEALSTTTLNITGYQITNTIGIESFTNLQNLTFDYVSAISSINLNELINIKNLVVTNCSSLTSIDLNGLVNLETFNCFRCSLVTLDLSNKPNLLTVDCELNLANIPGDLIGITAINFSGSNSITHINCSSNSLTSLNISNLTNLTYLNCYRNPITNLNITNSANLTFLDCSFNSLTTIDLNNNDQLTELYCKNNQINSLSVSNLVNLTKLDCSTNQITALDVSTLLATTEINCQSNQITSLNLSPLIQLPILRISNNPLNSIDVSALVNLQELSCYNCNLTSIDVTNLTNLRGLSCGKNLITTIDVSHQPLLNFLECSETAVSQIDLSHVSSPVIPNGNSITLQAGYNPNLTYINLKNGQNYTQSFQYITAGNSPNLTYICADEQNIIPIKNSLIMNSGGPAGEININNIQFNSYCTFVPGGVHNTITGTLTIDTNNNGCDNSDYKTQNIKVKINDGTLTGATFTNNNGDYSFYTQTGNFTLTPEFENPYFTITPLIATLNFSTLNNSTQTQDFCIIANGIHNDLEVIIIPTNSPMPGFFATYSLIYKNKGNQILSGTVDFTFNDAVLDFVFSNPTISSQTLNTLSWNYTDVRPFESRTINFYFHINAPTDTPAVNIGDILNSSASISPVIGDETNNDNVFNLSQTVVGSFDPNDKTCLEGNTILPEKVGDYLHYLIRFQNSGTAPAENIVVKDMIDTTKFDVASLQLTSTSHPQVTRITGNKVEFIFENIQLPAEQVNEPESHGFVAFKIRTKNNLVLGNTVSNTASIYFDYNFPIITNTTSTTVTALGINDVENTSVSILPNPTSSIVTINSNGIINSIQLYDVQGRLIETKLENSQQVSFDLSDKNSGIYFLKVFTENGVKVEKIIKE
jgi:Leucine-rich repeat (LRR) protein